MKKLLILSLAFLLFSLNGNAKTIKVKNEQELQEAIKNAVVGDEIVLANGVWKDV